MNNRELFFALKDKKEPIVLSWFMSFFSASFAVKLLGEDNVPEDSLNPSTNWGFGASSRMDWNKKIKYAEATGNFAIAVGKGACIAFGHGGPGEFLEKHVDSGENFRISIYETGVKKEVRSNPHFYHHFDYPVTGPEYDLRKLVMPDPDNPERYEGIAEEATYYKDHGFITTANLNGFFSGIHYYLYPYDLLLADLILEPEFIKGMLDKLGDFNLKAAENLLKCGVDMITFCDDLGSGSSMLMSPDLYRQFFFPWHKKLADLCHKYGASLHMHSHGNINKIVGDIYETGIDLLNPNDPYEDMDLPKLIKKYGDHMIFVGGIDKYFFEWIFEKQSEYITALVNRTGGGFILMDSGGVPENVTVENFTKIKNLFETAGLKHR